MEATSLRFAAAVRAFGREARRQGLVLPGFRSPPRVPGAERTLRWRSDGSAIVSVRLRERPWSAVLGDMIEGVVVSNGLQGPAAARCRSGLWAQVDERDAEAA